MRSLRIVTGPLPWTSRVPSTTFRSPKDIAVTSSASGSATDTSGSEPFVRFGNVTPRLHQTSKNSGHVCQSTGPISTPVLGRLEHHDPICASMRRLDFLAPQSFRPSRPDNQSDQVRPSAVQTLQVCRDRLRSERRHGQTRATQGPESSVHAADFSASKVPSAVRWQQLLGHMTSLEKLKLRGRLHMRRLQFVFHDNWDQSVEHPFCPVVVTLEVLPARLWWAQPSNVLQGVLLASLIN